MKTITAYAVVDKNGVPVNMFFRESLADNERTLKGTDFQIVKLTGEYDDTPELKPCPFCGNQPKVSKVVVEVTCCNGIKTDIESWESRV